MEKFNKGVFVRKLALVGICAAAGAAHSCSKPNVSEHRDECGEVVYKHSDKETEHILNCLAGRERLHENEKGQFFASLCKTSGQKRRESCAGKFR